MVVLTHKTVVPKTVTVGSVMLPTPADRIGLGFAAVAVTYPAEDLSQGQFPLPPNPGSEPNPGSRQGLSAMRMRQHPRQAATRVPPAGPAGWSSVPGSSARRRSWSWTGYPSGGWRVAAKRAAAAGRLTAAGRGFRLAGESRASFPGLASRHPRIGRDCQSPDRTDDRRSPDVHRSLTRPLATREATPATAAGK
jgi:hypothetical protein